MILVHELVAAQAPPLGATKGGLISSPQQPQPDLNGSAGSFLLGNGGESKQRKRPKAYKWLCLQRSLFGPDPHPA